MLNYSVMSHLPIKFHHCIIGFKALHRCIFSASSNVTNTCFVLHDTSISFFSNCFQNHVPLCLFSLDDPDMAHLYQYLIFFFFSKSFACLNGKLEEK